jgi:hypothetical protein
MSRIKNMSRGGWIVIGIVVGLLIVPSGVAVAKALAYTGIEGTNGATATLNKVDVTSGGQLLTTEASPSNYEQYGGVLENACTALTPTLPTGMAYVMQNVTVNFLSVLPQLTFGGYSNAQSGVVLYEAATSANYCSSDTGGLVNVAYPTGGNSGSVDVPFTPGYVVPNGYQIYADETGMSGTAFANGYLVPSADAPVSPQVGTNGKMTLPHAP